MLGTVHPYQKHSKLVPNLVVSARLLRLKLIGKYPFLVPESVTILVLVHMNMSYCCATTNPQIFYQLVSHRVYHGYVQSKAPSRLLAVFAVMN